MKISPCIGQCDNIDEKKALCLGCFRTTDEIITWWDKSSEERRKILKDLKYRRKEDAAERSATRFEPEST